MATPDPTEYIAAQNAAVRLAVRALRAFWNRLDHEDPIAVRDALDAFWPRLVSQFGDVTATLALDRFEEITGKTGVLADSAPDEDLNARMRWGLGPLFGGEGKDAALARLNGLVDELVKQPGRETLAASAEEHDLRFARIPVGKTCPFCRMVASQGFVYKSKASAGELRAFHSACDCRIAIEGEDVPGYDPDALMEEYLAAREAAGSGDPGEILAAWREIEAKSDALTIDGLDDDAADSLLARLMDAGDYDGAARIGELMDARNAATKKQVAEQLRDMSQDFHPAAYEWFENLSEDEQFAYTDRFTDPRMRDQFLQEQWSWANGGAAVKRANIPTERQIRAEWEDYVYAETLRLEEATRGTALSKKAQADGRRMADLLRVNEATARAWASEETRRYWDENGRLTYEAFKAGYTGDDEAMRRSQKAYWA